MGLLETITGPRTCASSTTDELDELASEIRDLLVPRSRAPAATSAPTSASSS